MTIGTLVTAASGSRKSSDSIYVDKDSSDSRDSSDSQDSSDSS